MKKKKAIIINIIIIAFSLLVYMTATGGAFTAEKAHIKQERTIHYGPSEIVGEVKQGNSKFFLTQFNGYYSCSMIERGFLGLWYGTKRSGMWGTEIDQSKPINYNQFLVHGDESNFNELYVYGVLNDNNIKKIEIDLFLEDAEEKLQTASIEITGPDEIFGDMFFGVIEKRGTINIVYPKRVVAFDQEGQLIYEEIDPNAEIYEEIYAE